MFQAPHLVSLIRFGEDEPSTPEYDFSTISQLPAFKEAVSIAARELAAQETQGLKHKNDELLNENKKFKSISANLRQGIDDEEDLKALSAGKITYKDIRDRHLNANNKEWQERHSVLESELETVRKEKAETNARLKRIHAESKIADAVAKNQFVQPSAIKDIKRHGAEVFDVDDEGNLIARDKNGNFLLNSKGGHMTIDEWVATLESDYSHYFVPQQGSGSRSGKSGSAKVMTAKEWTAAILSATPTEEKSLHQRKASGEIFIQH